MRLALPSILILAGALLLMSHFDIVQIARYSDLWPVILIGAGLEELYLWATAGGNR